MKFKGLFNFLIVISFLVPVLVHATLTDIQKTGQTVTYLAKDDGDLQRGVSLVGARFTDNGDGTVTDNMTELIWLKNANCYGPENFSEAIFDARRLNSGECGLSDNSVEGDWRLPNVNEIASLVNYAYFEPCISNTAGTGQWQEGDPFTAVKIGSYWSSTSYSDNSIRAYALRIHYGDVDFSYTKTTSSYVWPVKGGQRGLRVVRAGTGSGSVTSDNIAGIDCGNDCSESYLYNTTVVLTFETDPGSSFTGWTGDTDCSDGTVTLDTSKSCTATFNLPYSITTSAVPVAGAIVSCNPNPVVHGLTSTCTISANEGYLLATAEGSCGGTLSENIYTTNPINSDCTVIANANLLGDINMDESVNLTDAILALQIVVGLTPTVPVAIAADVNGDQKIGLAEVIYALSYENNAVVLSGRIELAAERQASSAPAIELNSLSPEKSATLAATSPEFRDAEEIWVAKLNVNVLNHGDEISGFFPVTKTIVPIGNDGTFNINSSDLVNADVLILADTNAVNPIDTIVGLIGIPDSDYLLENIPVEDLDQDLNLGVVRLVNGKWRSQTTLSQASNSFKSYSYGQLGEMAVIDDMVQSVINSFINYHQDTGQLFGTRVGIACTSSGLASGFYTDIPEVNMYGYAPHFRTNKGENQSYLLYPPYDVSIAGNSTVFGPSAPIPMGISPDGGSFYTYFSQSIVTPSVPEAGYWQLKDEAGALISQADLSFLSAYGGNGHPVLIPSIRPNLNGDGEIVSIDTKWYAVKNDNIEEIVDQNVLSRFIKSYGFQTSVKDPDNENYYFQGSIIGNTTVPWPILMQDVIDGSSGEYIKVNVGLYGSSFEFYFVE